MFTILTKMCRTSARFFLNPIKIVIWTVKDKLHGMCMIGACEKIPSDPVVGRVRDGRRSGIEQTENTVRHSKYGRIRGMVVGEGGRSTGVLLYYYYYCINLLLPGDGGWTVWSEWSGCTQTCGMAMMSRSRSCDSPKPQFGGKLCDGSNHVTQYCLDNPQCTGEWPSQESSFLQASFLLLCLVLLHFRITVRLSMYVPLYC